MVDEKVIYNYLHTISTQVVQQRKQIELLTNAVTRLRYSAKGQLLQAVLFGVKDVTTAQLVDAYQRGLNLEQLTELANGKYTAEQIRLKVIRAMGGNA